MKKRKLVLSGVSLLVPTAFALAACSDLPTPPMLTFNPAMHASYKAGAEAGNLDSICQWAMCCEQGLGTAKDEVKAFRLYRQAAACEHADACNRLGLCYVFARGTTHDAAKGVACFRKAAQQGNMVAMANLARCYENGIGVQRNLDEARCWYSKASAKGDIVSEYAYIMCLQGDSAFAEGDWLRRCAERNLNSHNISSRYYGLKQHWLEGQKAPVKVPQTYSIPKTTIRFGQ